MGSLQDSDQSLLTQINLTCCFAIRKLELSSWGLCPSGRPVFAQVGYTVWVWTARCDYCQTYYFYLLEFCGQHAKVFNITFMVVWKHSTKAFYPARFFQTYCFCSLTFSNCLLDIYWLRCRSVDPFLHKTPRQDFEYRIPVCKKFRKKTFHMIYLNTSYASQFQLHCISNVMNDSEKHD